METGLGSGPNTSGQKGKSQKGKGQENPEFLSSHLVLTGLSLASETP